MVHHFFSDVTTGLGVTVRIHKTVFYLMCIVQKFNMAQIMSKIMSYLSSMLYTAGANSVGGSGGLDPG